MFAWEREGMIYSFLSLQEGVHVSGERCLCFCSVFLVFYYLVLAVGLIELLDRQNSQMITQRVDSTYDYYKSLARRVAHEM